MPTRLTAFARRLPIGAVGALATHALVYRSFWPADGVHGYFGWYEPAVAVASLGSLVGLVVGLAVAAARRRAGRPILHVRVGEPISFGARARGAASASLLFLLVQESLEGSLAAGRPAVAQLAPSQWLTLVAGIAVVSFLIAALLRACELVVGRVLGSAAPGTARRVEGGAWSVVAFRRRRSSPLAERFGLRAPPLLPS